MKKILYILAIAMILPFFSSCEGMLEEQNYGNPTVDSMMGNEENIVLLVGQAYAELKWVHDHWGYWGVNSLTSDECLCPIRMPGEHWKDSYYWTRLNNHNWNWMGDAFKNIWNTTISGAVLCNKLLSTLADAEDAMDPRLYAQYVGELEVLRSYYYFLLFDCFGRIPYLEEFVDKTEPLMEPVDVWSNLVNCLERNAPNMPQVTDATRATNYGRVTQGFAYSLLARLYLNAESYGCTAANVNLNDNKQYRDSYKNVGSESDFYTNAVGCCDMVINSGSYGIESDYFANFKIHNENSRENIFVIVEDGNADFDLRYNGSMSNKLRMVHLSLHYCHQQTFNMIEKPWNGFCARPTFIDRYAARDVRGPGNEGLGTRNTKQWGWFIGPIYDAKGENLLQDENKEDAIVRKEVEDLNAALWGDGARMYKYEVDKAASTAWAENDFVLMRYADVLWMKEEAIVRGGAGASGANSTDFKTMLKRAFAYESDPEGAYAAAYPETMAFDLDAICDERGREFAWECVRRRDLIRFGKFNDPKYVEYVTATQDYRKWFPIPYSVIEKSKIDEATGKRIWTQNEGYDDL